MKVLYIGGTGEISYSCVRESVRLGQDVTVFNRGRCEEPLPEGVRQITGDLNDEAPYRKLGEESWDVVCQFLAYEVEDARRDLKVFGGRCGQYVFISSASAYRKPTKQIVVNEDGPLGNPFSSYAQKKADVDAVLVGWHG